MDSELHSFLIVAMQESLIEWHLPCGSSTVESEESESIGIGNVRIVQTVFLTRPTVKYSRSSADTDKSARRVCQRWAR